MFWGEKPEKRGRANLSRVLNNISSILPNSLHATQQDVEYAASPRIEIDIESVNQLVGRGDLLSLKEASDFFRGEFLDGLYIEDSPEFELWMTRERERWRQDHVSILNTLFAYNLSHRRFGEALQYVNKMLKLVPWREESHQQMMLLHALSGERSQAIAQYKSCCEMLKRELDVEPSADTNTLYKNIVSGELNDISQIGRFLSHQGQLLSPPNNLPSLQGAFIGRESEKERLSQLIHDDSRRLVTIIGAGGVGKTYLALHLAREALLTFPDGVYFISLESIGSTEELLYSIAQSLKINVQNKALVDEICEQIKEQRLLLILDNAEHLTTSATELSDLVSNTSSPKILITSRQAFSIKGEQLFHLEGLSYPADNQDKSANEFGAIQLFHEVSMRSGTSPSFDDEENRAIQEICRFVGGLPLAIEIAATWTPIVKPNDILSRIRESDEYLVRSQSDPGDRQGSIQVVFENSWMLLDEQEQALLQTLAVFKTSFTLKAFSNVTGGHPDELLIFVNKSWISTLHHGRFNIHGLLRRYLLSHLEQAGPNATNARTKHAQYYTNWLRQIHQSIRGKDQHYLLDQIEDDFPNIRDAWNWALEHHQWTLLLNAAVPIHYYFAKRSRFKTASFWFSRARSIIESLPEAQQTPDSSKLGTILILREGYFEYSQGNLNVAEQLLNSGLAIANNDGVICEAAFALNSLASIHFLRNDLELALKSYLESLDKYTAVRDQHGMAMVYGNLGLISFAEGKPEVSRELFDQSLELYEDLNDSWGLSYSLINLAALSNFEGTHELAIEQLARCLKLRRSLGDRQGIAFALSDLAENVAKLDRQDEAVGYFEESIQIFRLMRDTDNLMRTGIKLGRLQGQMGNIRSARQNIKSGLDHAIRNEKDTLILEVIIALGDLYMHQGDYDNTAIVLGFFSTDRTFDPSVDQAYKSILNELEQKISLEQIENLMGKSKKRSIDELLTLLANDS